ncbi:unnamed protein product [Lymnaea stagnalis]|uniref:Uncharacterized protein n=1 Tax=Lymnaea stagnalis TaxID=6523 RepID=A0AAV2HFI7_LYMST
MLVVYCKETLLTLCYLHLDLVLNKETTPAITFKLVFFIGLSLCLHFHSSHNSDFSLLSSSQSGRLLKEQNKDSCSCDLPHPPQGPVQICHLFAVFFSRVIGSCSFVSTKDFSLFSSWLSFCMAVMVLG